MLSEIFFALMMIIPKSPIKKRTKEILMTTVILDERNLLELNLSERCIN